MNRYHKIWAAIATAALATETVALVKGETTLSKIVWHDVTGVENPDYPKKLAIMNKVALGVFLGWLFVHFEFGWLSWKFFKERDNCSN